jgi:N utilization substance protein B
MSARGKARKLALDFLYESDLRAKSAVELLNERGTGDISQGEYVGQLLIGVLEHRTKIDEIITTYAEGWDLDRMPSVDRNILRIGIFCRTNVTGIQGHTYGRQNRNDRDSNQ